MNRILKKLSLVMVAAVMLVISAGTYNVEASTIDAGINIAGTMIVSEAEEDETILYTPRLTEPERDNEYYYSNMNLFHKHGYGLPNCTAYAYGRAYEILGEEPNLSKNGADKWYDYNAQNGFYEYGQEPRVGAIACWKNGGHVAVVEQVNDDGTVVISESRYGKGTFYVVTMKSDASDFMPTRTFQGYIYILPENVVTMESGISDVNDIQNNLQSVLF